MAAPDAQVFVMLKWVVPNSKASSTIAATSCLTDDSAAGIGVDQGSFFLIVSSHTYVIRVGVDFVLLSSAATLPKILSCPTNTISNESACMAKLKLEQLIYFKASPNRVGEGIALPSLYETDKLSADFTFLILLCVCEDP